MKGRTYRYFHGKPLYEFGYGLSYTEFAYFGAHLSTTSLTAGSPLVVNVAVRNTGKRTGDEVVEAYLSVPGSDVSPIRALVAFERVHLGAGETKDEALTIAPRQLSQVDAAGKRSIKPGKYVLYVGGKQPEAGDAGLPFEITGSLDLPE
jgi:beta-glucosidase